MDTLDKLFYTRFSHGFNTKQDNTNPLQEFQKCWARLSHNPGFGPRKNSYTFVMECPTEF